MSMVKRIHSILIPEDKNNPGTFELHRDILAIDPSIEIYALVLPQELNYPAIVIEDGTTEPIETWDTLIPENFEQNITINCYHDNSDDVSKMQKVCRNIVHRKNICEYEGNEIVFRLLSQELLSERLDFEPIEEQGNTGVYIASLEFEFKYFEAV